MSFGDGRAHVGGVIAWRPTQGGNAESLNEIGAFHRYFDATPQADLLYDCVRQTVEEDLPEEDLPEEDLPEEAGNLRRYDAFRAKVEAIVEMQERTIDLLFRRLRQNGGKLSKRARPATPGDRSGGLAYRLRRDASCP